MLGDDYGYANVGFAHGPNPGNPEMRTPTMDSLVEEGLLLELATTSTSTAHRHVAR
jgi:arylsulfatase A-like enzyme